MKKQPYLRRLRRYRPAIRSLDTFVEAEYGGSPEVDVVLYDGFSLFDPLSSGKQRELSRELYDFIDQKLYPIPLRYRVTLRFCHARLTAEEEVQARAAFQQHYTLLLLDKALDLKLNAVKITALSLLGVFLLGAWFAAQLNSVQPLFIELLSIAGTFSLWEAVGLYLLERKELALAKMNAAQTVDAHLVFTP